MKIILTSFYKTYFEDNTKNYVYYVSVFLISVIFFLLILWDRGSIYIVCARACYGEGKIDGRFASSEVYKGWRR